MPRSAVLRLSAFANGADQALELLGRERFDVVVSDMRMPGIDGAQLLMTVRDHHSDAVRVILSGQVNQEAAIRMVPVAHIALAKPCTGPELNRMIERACTLRLLLKDAALRVLLEVIEHQARQGVDYMTIHAGLLLEHLPLCQHRVTGIVSRGGGLLARWMVHHRHENPL